MQSKILFPKVTTGIPGLDDIIGGGYTKNSLITLSGVTGSGKTTFSVQFLVKGWEDAQEPGLYLSFDEPKFSIFANMASFGWDLPELERDKRVVFIEYPQQELGNFDEQERSLLELIDTLGVERVVFDSVSPFVSMGQGLDEKRMALQKLVSTVRKWGTTTIFTTEDMINPQDSIPRTVSGIETITDAFIHLDMLRKGDGRERTVEVIKMRGSPHTQVIYPAAIDQYGFKVLIPKRRGRCIGKKGGKGL